MKTPNRYSSQKKHNRYGVDLFLIKIGIPQEKHKQIVLGFCEHIKPGFKPKSKNASYAFIQSHFKEFNEYVSRLK